MKCVVGKFNKYLKQQHALVPPLPCQQRRNNKLSYLYILTNQDYASHKYKHLDYKGNSFSLILANCTSEDLISAPQDVEDQELKEICRKILLSFYACEGGYQFASQCLVETLIIAFKQGYIPEQIKSCIQLLGLQCGAQLLTPIEEDIVTQWIVIIHKTLVECYGTINSERVSGEESQMLEGLNYFVKQTMQTWLSGTTLADLEQQQLLARQEAVQTSGAVGPALKVMQFSARFVMLTLETVELVEDLKLRERDVVGRKSEMIFTDFVPEISTNKDEVRILAVQLLVCLIGGIMGSILSLNQFVLKAWEGYLRGYSVKQLVCGIQGYEFLQKADLIPVGVVSSGQANPESINIDIFTRWLSVVYMSWAQLGVPIANIEQQQDGWATTERQDAPEAIDLAKFVSNQLASYEQQQNQFQQLIQDTSILQAMKNEQANIIKQGQESVLVKVQDNNLAATSTTLIVMQQLVALIKIAVAQIERVVYTQTPTNIN